MKFKQVTDNGNIAVRREDLVLRRNSQNISWITTNTDSSKLYENRTGNRQCNSNCNNIYDSNKITGGSLKNYTTGTEPELENRNKVNVDLVVCNKQYRINTKNNVNLQTSTESTNLEGATETVLASRESFLGDTDVQAFDYTPVDDRAFELSDTDDMSENGIRPVPRGIVNPNYPGFHHLAHTLQDYSSNIENFYHSENEMTDDDVDIEITELVYEPEPNQNESPIEYKNINNNNNINDDKTSPMQSSPHKTLFSHTTILDSHFKNEMPDLLQTISKNNNNLDSFNYELNCTDTDIENNFHTKDIIGDFNKEIEDEIKQLLNYNINIQDDLEELRKDIKDTLAKPIETTINNISDVVNHVIKKLVETHVEQSEDTLTKRNTSEEKNHQENIDINKENETNTRTEMNLSRPTFLFIDNNTNSKIKDAFLSDGKEEINVNDYDPDKLSLNVENTIKQLSTELRKIIPKLDEMRERDRLWAESNKECSVITDGNSNEIASSSNCFSFISTDAIDKIDVCRNLHYDTHIKKNKPVKAQNEPNTVRERQKEVNASKSYFPNAQSNTSVRKKDSPRDCEFGSFDVYNIETALPKLDLDAIENHLKAAKEAERRKRNDREEIRKRLAMGADAEEYYSMGHTDRPGKKPSLHSRLQGGMNLQICFMNETASDNESQASEMERNLNYNNKSLMRSSIFSKTNYNHPYQTRPLSVNITKHDKISTVQSGAKLRPSSLTLKPTKSRSAHSLGHIELKESDFYALQATLQTEARIALAQAKEMAHIQMERERRRRAVSPVTEMVQLGMTKANAPLAPDRRRVSRQLLTDMNIAQLQVIVNELHSQIESLNDSLVKLLMARDELHMGQDSMLVDIEDLTRYLGVKEQTKKTKGTTKSGMKRLTSLVHK